MLQQSKIRNLVVGVFITILLLLPGGTLLADGISNFIKHAVNKGGMVNVNKAAILQDQRLGYITGGSIISRGAKPEELHPLRIQLPSFQFDPCTGSFDARFGAFSFIKGREFASFFKKVAQGSPAYVMKMAIQEVNPMIDNIMSYLETVAREVNALTMNQCAASQNIVSGMMSSLNNADKQRCMMQNNVFGSSNDLYHSTEKCTDNPYRHGEQQGSKGELESLLGDNYNLVWKAMLQNGQGGKYELQELIMSISGSVIGTNKNNIRQIKTLPSLIETEDMLERYIGIAGEETEGKVKLYKCDENTKCLKPYIVDENYNSEGTIFYNIERNIKTITNKILNNEGEFTDEEKALVEFSSIPLISLIEIEMVKKNKNTNAMLVRTKEFTEMICYDIVTNFMQRMLNQARISVEELASAQLDNTAFKRFVSGINRVQSLLRDKRFEALKKLQVMTQIKEQIEQQKRVFKLEFSRFMDNQSR